MVFWAAINIKLILNSEAQKIKFCLFSRYNITSKRKKPLKLQKNNLTTPRHPKHLNVKTREIEAFSMIDFKF